ncbi:MAG: UbiD family decarboxylase, partial [Candidatus Marsarchaeota archaeon]|nr:UbiD family decarboxylase [Candidatus Marsarchaeota archaeon]
MKGLTDLRRYLDYARARGELVEVDAPVDTTYEMAGIVKSMEGGPPVLFNNVNGHSGQRVLSNVFCNRQRLAAMLDTTPAYTARKFLQSVQNPVRPKLCDTAPSQEQVITSDIDLLNMLPVPKQTATDSGRLITGGMVLMRLPGRDDFNISYHRMVVVGPNLTTMAVEPSRHLMQAINER